MMTADDRHVTGGVDTHGEIHVAAVLDSATARRLAVAEFRAAFEQQFFEGLVVGPNFKERRHGQSPWVVVGALLREFGEEGISEQHGVGSVNAG